MINETVDSHNSTNNKKTLVLSLLFIVSASYCFADSIVVSNKSDANLKELRSDLLKQNEDPTLVRSTSWKSIIALNAIINENAKISKRKIKSRIDIKFKYDSNILKSFNINSSYLNNKLLNEEIKKQFLHKQPKLKHFLNSNKKYYISEIAKILNESKKPIPKYMIYLALNESNFNLNSLSNKRACGIWQFTKNTGRFYNLKINNIIDERKNVTKSSLAAINYLNDLNHFFKSWNLSIMAYNAGPNRIIEAFARAGIDKECYHFNNHNCLKNKRLRRYLKTFDLYKKKKIGFLEIQKIYKSVKKSQFKPTLNDMLQTFPDKNRQYLPLETRNYIKRIVASSLVFKDSLLKFHFLTKQYTGTPAYTYSVKRGDTLSKISEKYNITYTTLMKMNSLISTKILINQKLKIF